MASRFEVVHSMLNDVAGSSGTRRTSASALYLASHEGYTEARLLLETAVHIKQTAKNAVEPRVLQQQRPAAQLLLEQRR